LAIPASRSERSPAAFCFAADSIIRRDASSSVPMCASFSWII
jgi:hypothetical protein